MNKTRFLLNILVAVSLLLPAMPLNMARAQVASQTPEPPIVGYNDETGMVSFIGSEDGIPIPVPAASIASLQPSQRADAILAAYGPMFGIKVPGEELFLEVKDETRRNQKHYRYQQVFQGIPVMAGEIIVNMTTRGELISMSGEISPNLSLSIVPEITAHAARKQAIELAVKRYGLKAANLTVSEPALWIYDERLLRPSDRPAELVWRMEISAANEPLNLLVLVNAISGGIRLAFNQVDTESASLPQSQQATDHSAISSTNTLPAVPGRMPVLGEDGVAGSVPLDSSKFQSATNWYVATTGSDSNDCLTATTPCKFLNTVIGKAAGGDTILLGAGTYTSTADPMYARFSIEKNLTLRGGWDANFLNQNSFSILDGQGGTSLVVYISGAVVSMEFIHVVNGYTGISVVSDATLTASRCVVSGMTNGGITSGGTIIMRNCTISNNFSIGFGAIRAVNGTTLISNSTITGNTSTGAPSAGGIFGDHITLQNSILAGNHRNSTPSDCGGGVITSNGHNLIGTTAGCSITLQPTDVTGVDPKLGTLSSDGIIALLPGSPAIDAGDPAAPGSGGTACEATDQLGTVRPIDGDNNGTAVCDIGAYETSIPAPSVATTVSVVSGSSQATKVLTDFGNPLVAIVRDQYGASFPNASVTFTAPDSSASAVFSGTGTNTINMVTNAAGLATTSSLSANATTGTYTIIASTPGVSTTAVFSMVNWDNIIWYVSPTGNDSNDCRIPTTPCLKMDTPLTKPAFHPGDFVYVQVGTYTGSGTSIVALNNSVNLVGGWDSSFTTQIGYSTLDGQNARRGIEINPFAYQVNSTVTIDHFIIQNGYTSEFGGGIRNYGFLTITNTIVRNNVADLIGGGFGGGIYSYRSMTISQSAIYNNSAGANGGGIYLAGGSNLINNSTIAGNDLPSTAQNLGGGIGIFGGSTLSLNNVTIINNTARGAHGLGGGIYGSATLKNTMISGNQAVYYPDCSGPMISAGHNIIGNTTECNYISGTGDLTNIDPQVMFLSSSGIAPLIPSSLAIDAGDPSTCLAVDQRGVSRPIDGNLDGQAVCDIGSFEVSSGGTTPAYLLPYPTDSRYIVTGQASSVPFSAFLLDADGNAVPGVAVTFTAPASGASGTFSGSGTGTTTVDSNANGVATASTYSANSTAGLYSVQASISALPSPTLFSVINGTRVRTYTNQNNEDAFLPGVLLCTEADPLCTHGSDPQADFAQRYSIETYLFYLQHHGRNSIDNAGMTLVSSVHYGSGYENAFWNGQQMVYGDAKNYPSADDVVAHELTHGVTQYTSNLFYYYQSGAINESFSDLWGEFLDQTNGAGNDTPAVKWQIGEEIDTIRSMSNPPSYSDPDMMTSSYYHHGDQEDLLSISYDNGGVHTNSGVNNKAVYLMTDGGSFNGYTISGIGLNKVAAIYYETQTHLLTSGAGYKDLYYAIHQACLNVIGGTEGVTLADCSEVQKSLDAVEMSLEPVSNFTPAAQLCPTNAVPVDLFTDGFEGGTAQWTLPPTWYRTADYVASGHLSLYGPNPDSVSDTAAAMTLPITVPASGTTYLYFKQAFGFEYSPDQNWNFRTWDGGVLEYQLDGGAWQDAINLFDSGQGYNGQIYAFSGVQNPLASRLAFVRDSHGFVSSRYNLSKAAILGHQIKFRWRIGTDEYGYGLGWLLDDVRIYTCQTTSPGTPLFSDDFSTDKGWTNNTGGTVTRDANNQRLSWTARQDTPLHFTIPIYATNNPIQLDFRFKVNTTSGTSLLWAGLAYELDDHSPGVAAADLAGTFVGIDSTNKIQFLSLYPDLSYVRVDGSSSTLPYGGNSVWRRAILTISGTDWSLILKDDNGTQVGQMNGSMPKQQDHYDYLVLMYDNGGGTGIEAGSIDDIFVYGTGRTPTFSDVPYNYSATLGGVTYLLRDYIQALYDAGYTSGCGTNPLRYCPDQTMTRAESAVFMLRGQFGSTYAPPAAPWDTFADDWSPGTWAEKWAEGMWKEGMTAGCWTNPLKFCPWDQFPRVQAAVFGLRMKNGMSYTPPAASGTLFADMTDPAFWGTKWAEQAYQDGLLPSCGTQSGKPLFCPNDLVSRAWGAYLIVQAKDLPLSR